MTGRNRRRGRPWIIVGVLIVLGAMVAYGVMVAFGSKPVIDPASLVEVERGDIARSVVATGKIEPRAKVEVKSKASGIVKEIHVDYGEQVKAGQLLIELDKEELRARVREAGANLKAAEAARQAALAIHRRNEVEAEGPDLPFLKAAMERSRRLHRDGLLAASVLEETEKAYQLALNRQMQATRNLSVSRAEIARTEAQVAQAQAVLDRAEEDLGNSTIVSPMDALVLSRDIEVGDAVSSILVLGSQATLLLTLGDVGSVYVLGRVDEADIGKVYLDQPARIIVESFKDKRFDGRVTKISPLGVERDNVTTFEVRASIDNPGGELKVNMTANAEIILEERTGVLLIPEVAVSYDRERNASVAAPDLAAESGRREIPVKLGISNGVKTEIVEGLEAEQQIILP